MWAQKARDNWLQLGDRNTKYFQTFANIRRKRNEISKVKDSNGPWWVKGEGLKEVFVQNFKLRFLSLVSLVKTQSIILQITNKEIWNAVHSIGALDAPVPDGLYVAFYQGCWATVKGTVCNLVKDFFC